MYPPQSTAQQDTLSELSNVGPDTRQPDITKKTKASATILDLLNLHCWEVILDELDINDIVRLELVSRHFHPIVCDYLPRVHNYGIKNVDVRRSGYNSRQRHKKDRLIHIHFEKKDHFEQIIQRIGPFVQQMSTDCLCEKSLLAIIENCPNIETLRFYGIQFDFLKSTTVAKYAVENLKWLKSISFESCRCLEDFCSDAFISKETFEELEFINSFHASETFWLDFKSTNLKSVSLTRWRTTSWSQIRTASRNWTSLTKLQLDDNTTDILAELQSILDNVPNLEHLSLCGYPRYSPPCVDCRHGLCCSQVRREFYEKLVGSIGRRSNLKHLYLARNGNVSDLWLQIIALNCNQLRTLDIGCCIEVTGRGVGELRRLAPTLRALSLAEIYRATDADLIDCVSACHLLTFLDVSRCAGATPRLVEAAERSTRHRKTQGTPLLLRLNETDMSTVQILKASGFPEEKQKQFDSYAWYLPQQIQVKHGGLVLDWCNKAPEAHLPLRGPLAQALRSRVILNQALPSTSN